MNALHPAGRALPRRLVLLGALVAGLLAAAAFAPSTPPSRPLIIIAEAAAQAKPEAPPEAAPAPPPAPDAKEPARPRVDAEITIDPRGVTVRKGNGGSEKRVHVGNQEFESFEQFVEQAPWLAGLVFLVTALVFVVPLLVIVLVIWYKVRRTRMMNETMLKLAERGVVPPAEAMETIATGRPGPALNAVPPTAPLYEQAKTLRKRAAWSDLRKGVLIGGVGLGLTLWPLLEGDNANGFGLVLLFVGIGYTVLWYLEDRQDGEASRRVPPPGAA